MLEEELTLLNELCTAISIQVNPHKIEKKTISEYVQKLKDEVDSILVEDMIDYDSIVIIKAFFDDKKIMCYDFLLESAIVSVTDLIKEQTEC